MTHSEVLKQVVEIELADKNEEEKKRLREILAQHDAKTTPAPKAPSATPPRAEVKKSEEPKKPTGSVSSHEFKSEVKATPETVPSPSSSPTVGRDTALEEKVKAECLKTISEKKGEVPEKIKKQQEAVGDYLGRLFNKQAKIRQASEEFKKRLSGEKAKDSSLTDDKAVLKVYMGVDLKTQETLDAEYASVLQVEEFEKAGFKLK